MTPDAQRTAIAQACPRVACKDIHGQWVWTQQPSRLFDPLDDLNAMHEAEKVLKSFPAKWREYRKRLNWLADYGVTATATERADAFIKTLNLLDDSK